MEFEILLNDSLFQLSASPDEALHKKKHLLSVANDYEDGEWRHSKFDDFIWDNIAQTALTESERTAMLHRPGSLLRCAAENLRLTDAAKDISKGSELAEIFLYGVMLNHYKALSVVPKIFYKQNTQDNAKGADSVHIVLSECGGFTLWFGEAKFYNSIENSRLSSIIESVGNSLSKDKLKKENSIVTNLRELDDLGIDENVVAEIKEALSGSKSIDSIKPIVHVPILLLHECEITASGDELTDELKEDISAFHKERAEAYFAKQDEALNDIHKYADITFHLILFPVPEKKPVVERFVGKVKHHRR